MKIGYGDAVSDVLTTVLNALQFQGKVFCYTKFTSPWAIRLNRKEYAHFHFVERGRASVVLEETGAETWLAGGDLVIVPRGDSHLLRDSGKTRIVNVEELLVCRDVLTLRHGGGGSETTTVCGRLLLKIKSEIPSCLCCLNSFTCHAKKYTAQLGWSQCFDCWRMRHNPREGSGTIIGHLTGIIFVQAVR